MPRESFLAMAFAAIVAASGQAQFPLGPGNHGPQPVVDPAINEYISRTVVEHAIANFWIPLGNPQVELVSARWQGDLVFVFSRVSWVSKHKLTRAQTPHVAEVQYSMMQRRFYHSVFDIYCCATKPTVYQYYDLGRIRTRINDELTRFDKIAGDNLFPGPWARGPATMVPQVSAGPGATPAPAASQPMKALDEPMRVVPPAKSARPVAPPAPLPFPTGNVPPETPPSSTGLSKGLPSKPIPVPNG